MIPIAHPGVAYLLYAGITRASGKGTPTGHATIALTVGALLPDLIDQPLYVVFDLPSTRTVFHSLVVAVPVCLAVAFVAHRGLLRNDIGAGFIVGYLSHPFADALWPLVYREFDELWFLFWPLTPSPPYQGQRILVSIEGHAILTTWVELGLLGIAIGLWWRHGTPGLALIRQRLPISH